MLDDLVPEDLHQALWKATRSRNWYFGAYSNDGRSVPFWNMDLNGVPAADAVWQHTRTRCEELAGEPLLVIRQYANGHTFGQGGRAHRDDRGPGNYTLLYYPMPQWHNDWDGGTEFHTDEGDLIKTVQLRPNRAVFFDANILHFGRAPSRLFTGLRVSVAFKLRTEEAERRHQARQKT
jgi:SM-20-related protein